MCRSLMKESLSLDHPMFDTSFEHRVVMCKKCYTEYAGLVQVRMDLYCTVCNQVYDFDSPGVYDVIEAEDNYRTFHGAVQGGLINEN